MRRTRAIAALLACCLAGRAPAQERTGFEKVPLRVVSVTPGVGVVVDRGRSDLLEEGDRVLLVPRDRTTVWGTVARLEERTATVQLDQPGLAPPAGTRGEAMVPRARFGPPPEDPRDVPPDDPDPTEETPERHEWPERDDRWSEDMPLLARVRPVRPDERPTTFSGRVWSAGGLVYVPSERGDFDNSLLRVGTEVRVDNPFGHGGGLRFDGEVYHRTEWDEEDSTRVLVRGLSYGHGGTRFSPARWEAGRFIQFGMPEFGYLDGFEWGRRTPSGDRFGASIGFLPEVDEEFETGRDFQIAGYYHWAQDDRELVTFTAGYQKSFNDGDADRDLIVLKARALDLGGWDALATTWIDLYTSKDDQKDGVGLTYALATLTRRFDDGSGLALTYRHQEFAQLLREEFLPVLPQQLADDRVDRLWIEGWSPLGETTRIRGEAGVWNDEDETGGNAELGFGFLDAFVAGGDLELTAFGSAGRFESLIGGRIVFGRTMADGRWDLLYELANHHLDHRPSDGDDLLQHRVRASWSTWTTSGWTWSFHGDSVLWDEELSFGLGFFVQRDF